MCCPILWQYIETVYFEVYSVFDWVIYTVNYVLHYHLLILFAFPEVIFIYLCVVL